MYAGLIISLQEPCGTAVEQNKTTWDLLSEWMWVGLYLYMTVSYIRFFAELNTVLFRTMLDISSCEDHVMTIETMTRLGLDPVCDKSFISDLAVLYGFDVVVQRNNGMCWCTDCYSLD